MDARERRIRRRSLRFMRERVGIDFVVHQRPGHGRLARSLVHATYGAKSGAGDHVACSGTDRQIEMSNRREQSFIRWIPLRSDICAPGITI